MPTNLFGPGDNFDLENSHVAAALLRKAHEAKHANTDSLTIWGSGTPKREFLYVDDCADALVHLLARYSGESHVNIGTGQDVTIRELAETIADVVGFQDLVRLDLHDPRRRRFLRTRFPGQSAALTVANLIWPHHASRQKPRQLRLQGHPQPQQDAGAGVGPNPVSWSAPWHSRTPGRVTMR